MLIIFIYKVSQNGALDYENITSSAISIQFQTICEEAANGSWLQTFACTMPGNA